MQKIIEARIAAASQEKVIAVTSMQQQKGHGHLNFTMINHNMDFFNYFAKIVAFTMYFAYKLCYNGSLNKKTYPGRFRI